METDVYAWIIPLNQFHMKSYQQLKTKAFADLAVPSPHSSSHTPQQGTHTFWQSSAQRDRRVCPLPHAGEGQKFQQVQFLQVLRVSGELSEAARDVGEGRQLSGEQQ